MRHHNTENVTGRSGFQEKRGQKRIKVDNFPIEDNTVVPCVGRTPEIRSDTDRLS